MTAGGFTGMAQGNPAGSGVGKGSEAGGISSAPPGLRELLRRFAAHRSHWLDSDQGRAAVNRLRAEVEQGERMPAVVLWEKCGWRIALQALGEGAVIPLHDHPQTRGLLSVIEGRLRVEHFDVVETVRGTRRTLLVGRGATHIAPGSWDWIGIHRHNLHSLESEAPFTLVFGIRHSRNPGSPRSAYAFPVEPVAGQRRVVALRIPLKEA